MKESVISGDPLPDRVVERNCNAIVPGAVEGAPIVVKPAADQFASIEAFGPPDETGDALPPWTYTLVYKWASILNLRTWRFYVKWKDDVQIESGGQSIYVGSAQFDVRGYWAAITISRHSTEEQIAETLLHELLHIAFAHMENTVEARILELVPPKLRKHAHELWEDAQEQDLESLARSLHESLTVYADAVAAANRPAEEQEEA